MQDIQYQQRTDALTDRDILEKLPQMIDLKILTDTQQDVLLKYRQKANLLKWLCGQENEQRQVLHRQKAFNASNFDLQQTELRLETLRQNVRSASDDLLLFESEHSSTIKSLIRIGLPLIEAEEREKSRQMLEEWRRQRDAKLNAVPAPITDNLRVSESQKSVENTSETAPQKKGITSLKSKLMDALGSVGIILWYLISLLIAIIPLVMIDASFGLNLLLLAVVLFIPATSGIFWIWGLVCAINGPQDAIAIIYYVLFAIMFLPYFINAVLSFFIKRK